MPIYEFGSNVTMTPEQRQNLPLSASELPAGRQLSHADGKRKPLDGTDFMAYSHHLEEFLMPGFRALDNAMKLYWSGIRVPTKDSYRFMRVKIAGGDKSLLIWKDDLTEGRARLPLAAISRDGHEFNVDKFSPAYHPMAMRWVTSRGNLAARVFRPVPFLVNYSLTVWAEHKRDIEYIMYQMLPRFNPLAEFRMSDGKLEGNVQLRFGGTNDVSDKEVGFDQHANVRYETNMVAEAWLPLPELIIPTVLGTVKIMREKLGEILLASLGNIAGAPGGAWYEPIQDVSQANSMNRSS